MALEKLGLNPNELHSIILLDGDRYYERSDAALRIAKNLSGLWPTLYVYIILPRIFRDWLYNIVAHNRYKVFGKKDECWLPDTSINSRFIS
jgi:predicted DCC family thiol-disulfide oxidoreductase YuxK